MTHESLSAVACLSAEFFINSTTAAGAVLPETVAPEIHVENYRVRGIALLAGPTYRNEVNHTVVDAVNVMNIVNVAEDFWACSRAL